VRLKNDFKPQSKPLNTIAVMKKILPLLLAVIAFSSSSQAALVSYNATPTIGTSNTFFNFSVFNSDLGTLTAVDLLLNSSVAGGSVSIDTTSSGESATLNSLTSYVRTSGTGLTQQNTTPITLSLSPSLAYTVPNSSTQLFSVTGSPSFIPSTQTYSINSANWSSYMASGGSGNTPNFTGRAFTTFNITSDVQPATINSLFTAASNYTLRYTYTPTPSGVPEPSQVAASLLVIGGLGIYFLRRRRKVSTL
jgi:hypothetical protein